MTRIGRRHSVIPPWDFRNVRFGLLSLFIAVALCAIATLCVREYLDYRADYVNPPPDPSERVLTQADIAKLRKNREHHRRILLTDFPAKSTAYWELQLAKVRPSMTCHALRRYVPSAGPSYSILRSDGNQTIYYPVDAKFGIACILKTTDQTVVKTAGVFEHSLALDDFGGIDLNANPAAASILTRIE